MRGSQQEGGSGGIGRSRYANDYTRPIPVGDRARVKLETQAHNVRSACGDVRRHERIVRKIRQEGDLPSYRTDG